ncbi:MAG: AAA family ATPase, partial [Deltaproteobacteria bacterium]|nr:AAA family ATPase [Deltaproteobacteria bacterium]
RLQLCDKEGQIYQGAVVLFGKEFLPHYPQCELRMARFRGTDKTEFLDQKNVRAPAFKLLEEAEIFCQRHFPLPAKIVPTQMRRVEKPLIPPEAMREILVNALIHRDYSIVGGSVSLAIFDDRVEVWSIGDFPKGITPAMLSKNHPSVLRNPTIADLFHRTGLIEKWGRGTNRVIEMCKAAGVKPPKFEEIANAAVVTFYVNVGVTRLPAADSTAQVSEQVSEQVGEQVLRLLDYCGTPRTKHDILEFLGLAAVYLNYKRHIYPLLKKGLLELTIPDKPQSRLQKYRVTEKGRGLLAR